MIRFFHTADIHFGVENYGKIDPQTGIHTRLLDFKNSFAHCVDMAIEQNIDFLIFAGDAYKTATPTPTQQKLLLQQFLRLQKAGIPAVIIVGNHDHPLSFGKATALDLFGDLPVDGFHIFAKPGVIKLETKNGPIQVVGIPWPSRHNLLARHATVRFKTAHEITQNLSLEVCKIINNIAEKLDPNIPAILGGHLTVTSGVFSGSEKTAVFGNDPVFLPSQLAIKPFDYIALGHLHRHQDLNKGGRCPLVYAGSIERVDFGERNDTKGFCDVTISSGSYETRTTSYKFELLPTRPMIQIDIKMSPTPDQTKFILEKIKDYDLTDAIVKIVYHLPPDVKDAVNLAAIYRACADAIHVAAIVPIHTQVKRERRAQINIDMDQTSMLTAYLTEKCCSTEKIDHLIRQADALRCELDNEQSFEENSSIEAEQDAALL